MSQPVKAKNNRGQKDGTGVDRTQEPMEMTSWHYVQKSGREKKEERGDLKRELTEIAVEREFSETVLD